MNIYWFYHELSRAVENTRETALGLGKIEFWADSVEKIFDVISPLFQRLYEYRIIPSKNPSLSPYITLARIIHYQKVSFYSS